MGKRMANRLDDDYFAEPNYDNMTDEELDELYHFGEVRSARKPKKAMRKVVKKSPNGRFTEDDDDWMDLDLDLDSHDDLYDD